MNELDSTRLRELLQYDPETGIFTWAISRKGCSIGTLAGNTNKVNGYQYICIDGYKHTSQRLAWVYVYGRLPNTEVDHINHNKLDNRISNLREVTRAENMQNLQKARNSSGFIGLTFSRNRWVPSIRINGKKKYLGVYKTPEEAHHAYVEAKRKFHPFGNL